MKHIDIKDYPYELRNGMIVLKDGMIDIEQEPTWEKFIVSYYDRDEREHKAFYVEAKNNADARRLFYLKHPNQPKHAPVYIEMYREPHFWKEEEIYKTRDEKIEEIIGNNDDNEPVKE